jgi:hypothetical protein
MGQDLLGPEGGAIITFYRSAQILVLFSKQGHFLKSLSSLFRDQFHHHNALESKNKACLYIRTASN